jgi:hypothetical protein
MTLSGSTARASELPACGLPVPEADLLDVAGVLVLAVKRYDRQDAPAVIREQAERISRA